MDFFRIVVKELKKGGFEARPDFLVKRSKDLMVRAKNFYAIWDEKKGLWSTDEYDVQRIVDESLREFQKQHPEVTKINTMESFNSSVQTQFRKYMSQISDNSHQLDEKLTFSDTEVKQTDYVSKRLPYSLKEGTYNSWDKLVGKLYQPEERAKIEWAIGAIISGDSKKIQKFIVLHGPPGAGKGTIIEILLKLFDGYITTFNAKALGSSGNQFAASAFAGNPLVAIQHDGDLSRIEDNTTLNSIISHEIMKVNEKYKPQYDSRINAFLFMGTNKPVKITDAQSGLIRRLIDVHPSRELLSPSKYHDLFDKIDFELGAIAYHCLQVYKEMGKNYYSNYRPVVMMAKTNAFYNFIDKYYDLFKQQDGVSALQGWKLFKEYCEEANVERSMSNYAFKSELSNYFGEFHERHTMPDGTVVRSWYAKFKAEPFKTPVDDEEGSYTLVLEETKSLLDVELADYTAQYAKADGSPAKYWDDSERIIDEVLKRPDPTQIVSTLLKDLDTSREHFVKPPENLIVIDFDLVGEDGSKSLEKNLEAAAGWPATYAELSKSGSGVHLHYYWDGDVSKLARQFLPGIEIKVFAGNSSLRRRLSLCNDVPIATLTSGLPLKENKQVLGVGTLSSEKALRELIARNLRKEIHGGTKPSIDFIHHILEQEYHRGELKYDVSDLYQTLIAFANNSTNQRLNCLKAVQSMKLKAKEDVVPPPLEPVTEERLVFWDVEVYPNLFVVCWKFEEENPSVDSVTRMINPSAQEIEALMHFKLVGFNNRSYDNHIMWAAALGYNNEQLYNLSKKIISDAVGCHFGEAWNVSHTDVYDYSTEKKGLKKWQIELGLEHREMDIPWDQPVPKERIMDVVDYCANDVVSLEYVHKHRSGDWKARLILADLSGLTPNDTTRQHTTKIVFGSEKNPQRHFVYTDLSKEFPGYVFELGKSTYRGELVGEGGYVYAEPGLYRDVALLDVASMHPTSIGRLNVFGEYTPRFMALVEAQLAIKHGDYDLAKKLLDGKLVPYIMEIEALQETDREAAKKAAAELRYGLKIAINIVYGLTSAKFPNAFNHPRNVDNIVAKCGALFMIDLKHYIQSLGYTVAHIKTDSVKIPNATPEIIDAVINFGAKYGYTFEHEATYSKFALVNDAVYIAKKDECITNCWEAKGAQFQHPYVFKKLFGYEDDITYRDLCETKHVTQGTLHLDFGIHELRDKAADWGTLEDGVTVITDTGDGGWIDRAQLLIKQMKKQGVPEIEQDKVWDRALSQLIFVGKTGQFTPVLEGYGGGTLWRRLDNKVYAVQGTKNHLWADSAIAKNLPGDAIDYQYFDDLLGKAIGTIEAFLAESSFSTIDEFLS